MKQIVDGRLYNTDTAKELGFYKVTQYDLSIYSGWLYITAAGKYFIYEYVQESATLDTIKHRLLVPLTPIEARVWAEQKLSVEDYTLAFGEPEEASEDSRLLIVSLPNQIMDRLDGICSRTGIPLRDVLIDLLP